MELAKQKQRLQDRGICDSTQNIFMISRVDIVDEGDSEMFGKLFHDAFTEPMSAKVNEIMQQTIEGNDDEITCKNQPVDVAIDEMFRDIIRVYPRIYYETLCTLMIHVRAVKHQINDVETLAVWKTLTNKHQKYINKNARYSDYQIAVIFPDKTRRIIKDTRLLYETNLFKEIEEYMKPRYQDVEYQIYDGKCVLNQTKTILENRLWPGEITSLEVKLIDEKEGDVFRKAFSMVVLKEMYGTQVKHLVGLPTKYVRESRELPTEMMVAVVSILNKLTYLASKAPWNEMQKLMRMVRKLYVDMAPPSQHDCLVLMNGYGEYQFHNTSTSYLTIHLKYPNETYEKIKKFPSLVLHMIYIAR